MNTSTSVDINGDKIRTVREQKGLTQLYLATVVGVTTDTISRWENRRYPAIKLENAKKLAEALEIPLEELLAAEQKANKGAQEEPTTTLQAATTAPTPSAPFLALLNKRRTMVAGIVLVVAGLGIAAYWWLGRSELTAERIMPPHTAPNLPFPVRIDIRGPVESQASLLIRETITGEAEATGALEEGQPKQFGKNPRWIGRLDNGHAVFIYLVTPGKKAKTEERLSFDGDLISREGQLLGDSIAGAKQTQLTLFHWADTNQDSIISDDEILRANETYALPGSTINFTALEELWLAGKYSWNKRMQAFEPAPSAPGKEKETNTNKSVATP
jgi:transcriptional regulator with XRE-family HTH domain